MAFFLFTDILRTSQPLFALPSLTSILPRTPTHRSEVVLDTQNRDKTDKDNYVHLNPENCAELAKQSNWQASSTTFEEDTVDATNVDPHVRAALPERADTVTTNDANYIALGTSLLKKQSDGDELYAVQEPNRQ